MSNKVICARAPHDMREEHGIRRLAASRTTPRGLVQRARIVALSWDGASVRAISEEVGLHPTTVRQWLCRFNLIGAGGLLERPRPGRPRLLDAAQREWLVRMAVEPKAGGARWTLDSLVEAAAAAGIQVSRSQLRRILLTAGITWHSAPDSARTRARSRSGRPSARQGDRAAGNENGTPGRGVAGN